MTVDQMVSEALRKKETDPECINALFNPHILHGQEFAQALVNEGFRVFTFEKVPKEQILLVDDENLTMVLMELDCTETLQ